MQQLSSSPKYTINTPQQIEIEAGTLQLKTNDTCIFTPHDGDPTQYTLDINHRDSFKISKTTYDEIFRVQNFCTATVRRALCPLPLNTSTSIITVEQLKTTISSCQSTFDTTRGHGKSLTKGKADRISAKLEAIIRDSYATTQTIRAFLRELLNKDINALIAHTSPDGKKPNPTKHSATCTLRDSIVALLGDIESQPVPFTAVCSAHNIEHFSPPVQLHESLSGHEQLASAAADVHPRARMELPAQAIAAAETQPRARMELPIQAAAAVEPPPTGYDPANHSYQPSALECALAGHNAYDKASYCTEIALAVQETYELSDGEYVEFTVLDHHYVMTNQQLLQVVKKPERVVQIPQITPAEISKILLLQKYDTPVLMPNYGTPLYKKNNDRSLEITDSLQVARWQDEAIYKRVNPFRPNSRITPPALPPKLLLDDQKPENSDVLSHFLMTNGFHVSCHSDGTPILTLCYEVEEQSGIIRTEKFKLSGIKYEDDGLSTQLLWYKSPSDPLSDFSFRIEKTPRGYWLKQNKVVYKIEQSELDGRYYQLTPQRIYESPNGETEC